MGTVPIELFLLVCGFFLVLLLFSYFWAWQAYSQSKKCAKENAELRFNFNSAVNTVGIYKSDVVRYKNEAERTLRECLALIIATKDDVIQVNRIITYVEKQNEDLKRQILDLMGQLEEKSAIIEQLRRRVVSRTGPLDGDKPNDQ